jgi:TRAP transporter TAXI family solute receptor
MTMKRIFNLAILVSALATALSPAAAAEKAGWPKTVSIGAASIGGSFYVCGTAYAKIIQEKLGIPTSVEVTGGSIHNPQHVHAGTATFGMAAQSSALQAYTGEGWAKGKKYDNIRAVWPQYPSLWQGWTVPRTGIKTLRDIEERIISCGPAGGLSTIVLPEFCKALGIKYKRMVFSAFGDTVGQMRDGLIDAAFAYSGIPMPAINEVTSTLGGSLVGFLPKDLEKLLELFPYHIPATIPANSYPGQTTPVATFADWVVVFANKNTPDDFVYEVLKNIFANKEVLVAAYKGLENVQEENVKAILLPLHRGAYRFYKERNLPVPKKAMPID